MTRYIIQSHIGDYGVYTLDDKDCSGEDELRELWRSIKDGGAEKHARALIEQSCRRRKIDPSKIFQSH
jgi:hypothetical protein